MNDDGTNLDTNNIIRFRFISIIRPFTTIILISLLVSSSHSTTTSCQLALLRSLELRRGSPELDPKCGDLVIVFIRHQGRGRKRRPVTSMGVVEEVDSRDPLRVKTDRCPNKFHEVLDIKRRSTSMISNDTHSSSEDSISQPY